MKVVVHLGKQAQYRLAQLGHAQLAGGDPAARAAWSAALAILDELGHAETDDMRDRLSTLPDAGSPLRP